MRRRPATSPVNLAAISAERALKLFEGGEARETPIAAIEPGDLVLVRAGERIAVDGDGRGRPLRGRPEPGHRRDGGGRGRPGRDGLRRHAQPLPARCASACAAPASGTLLDEVNALLDKAVEQRSSYVQPRRSRRALYAPVVHLTALATFLGWLALGAGWQQALVVAITVLIITCPCALGLAVPAVQVVAAGALFRHGLMLNSGEALERLAEADTVVFDKTGTLTLPRADARQCGRHRARGSARSPARWRCRANIRSPRRSPRRPAAKRAARRRRSSPARASPPSARASVSSSARSPIARPRPRRRRSRPHGRTPR